METSSPRPPFCVCDEIDDKAFMKPMEKNAASGFLYLGRRQSYHSLDRVSHKCAVAAAGCGCLTGCLANTLCPALHVWA